MKKIKFSTQQKETMLGDTVSRRELSNILGGEALFGNDVHCPDGSASITGCSGVATYNNNWFSNDTIVCSGPTKTLVKTCAH